MRILSILALSAMALTATAQSYTVTGKIDAKYNGKTVYLTEQVNVVDSAVVENGAFKFERKADDQTLIKITMQNNKRMKIPGFSSLEKTPQGLILNTARTNKGFRDALLDACVAVILDGDVVDLSKSLIENKQAIARERWLGVAAAFLKSGSAQDTEEITRLISEYEVKLDEPVSIDVSRNKTFAFSSGGAFL